MLFPKMCFIFQVDSKGVVNQFLSKHSQTMLDKLNEQRLSNQFCDITLLIEGEEYRAHKAVLAACSEYFNELFFEKGAASTHEAVVDLSGEHFGVFFLFLAGCFPPSPSFNIPPSSCRVHQSQLPPAPGLCIHIHAYV